MQKITFVLLKSFLSSPNNSRPDILHQVILSIIDSPLNKSCDVSILIFNETNNSIIEICNGTKVPRTLQRFLGLIKQLKTKLKIKNEEGQTLMKFIKGPLNKIVDENFLKVGMSREGEKICTEMFKDEENVAVYINCIAKGSDENIKVSTDKFIKVSEYDLSAFVACVKICTVIEQSLGIF